MYILLLRRYGEPRYQKTATKKTYGSQEKEAHSAMQGRMRAPGWVKKAQGARVWKHGKEFPWFPQEMQVQAG